MFSNKYLEFKRTLAHVSLSQIFLPEVQVQADKQFSLFRPMFQLLLNSLAVNKRWKEFRTIYKTRLLGISIQKCGAQRLGRILDHFKITFRNIKSEMGCTKTCERISNPFEITSWFNSPKMWCTKQGKDCRLFGNHTR